MKILTLKKMMLCILLSYSFLEAESLNYHKKADVLKLLENKPYLYLSISRPLQKDLDVVQMVLKDGYGWEYATVEQLSNKKLLERGLKKRPYALCHLPNKLRNDARLINAFNLKYKVRMMHCLGDKLKQDKVFLTKLILLEPSLIRSINKLLKKDKIFLTPILKKYPFLIYEVSQTLHQDNNFMLKFVKKYGYGFEYLTQEQKDDMNIILALMDKAFQILGEPKDSWFKDARFVTAYIQKTGKAWQYASEENKKDKKLILSSLDSVDSVDSLFLQYVDKKLLADDIIFDIKLLKKSLSVYNYLPKKLQESEELLLIALAHNSNIYDIEKAIKKSKILENRTFVEKLISLEYNIYPFLPQKFQMDKEIILACAKTSNQMLAYIPPQILENKVFTKRLLDQNTQAFSFLPKKLRNDKEVLLMALETKGVTIEIAQAVGAELLNNNVILRKFLEKGYLWTKANEENKKDETLILTALKNIDSWNKKDVLRYIDQSLLKNRSFLLLALLKEVNIFTVFNENIKNDKTFLLQILKQYPKLIEELSDELQHDPKLLKIVLPKGYGWSFASEANKRNQKLILEALEHNFYIFYQIDKSIKEDKEFIKKAMIINIGAFSAYSYEKGSELNKFYKFIKEREEKEE